jgi:hypothetical protein
MVLPANRHNGNYLLEIYPGYGIVQLKCGDHFVWVKPSDLEFIVEFYKRLGGNHRWS